MVESTPVGVQKRRSVLAMVMTGCLLVGASYALLNTQTHAVGAVAAVGVQDSKVVDLVFAMEDMERGLQEMAQSVEHMQEMLKRSPMVQALAQRKPEVKQILNDPKKLQEEMALVQPHGPGARPAQAGGEADLERPEEAAGGDGHGAAESGGAAEGRAVHAEPAQAPAGDALGGRHAAEGGHCGPGPAGREGGSPSERADPAAGRGFPGLPG